VAQLSPDQLFWIKDACRRLSSSTGWPIVFRTLEELPTESPLPAPAYQHQEAGLIGGMLCVDLPPEYVQHDDWPAVRQLVHAQAEFINRVISLENSCRLETSRREKITEFVSVIANRGGPEENLPRLMKLACDVSRSEGCAIFLLSADNQALNLIGQTSEEGMNFALPHRPLVADAPDVQAGIKGATEVLLTDNFQRNDWLPEGWQQGICLTLRIGNQPIGSLWVYRTQKKSLNRQSLEFLERLADTLSIELERIALLEESNQRFRLRKELKAALPSRLYSSQTLPLSRSLHFEKRHESRELVGGDLCKLMRIDHDRTAILLGDATGDSIPAALIRAHAEGAIHYSLMHADINPEETDLLMENINRSLCDLLSDDHFFSLFLGIWNERTRELSCTNAGHPAPLLISGNHFRELNSQGMLLGVLPTSRYSNSTLKLQDGDQLIIFSDGISESISQTRFKTIRQLTTRARSQERYQSREGLADLLWETAIFADDHEDDRSLLVIEIASHEEAQESTSDASLKDRRIHPDHPPKYHGDPHGPILPPDETSVSYDPRTDIVFPHD